MTTTDIKLPKNVLQGDLTYPRTPYDAPDDVRAAKRVVSTLTLYYTARFGWVITTLEISRARRGSAHQTDRSYGIAVKDQQAVRVGSGPHVLKSITIYVREERREALQYLIDLHEKGMAVAGDARDRRSTRALNSRMSRDPFSRWL